MSCAVYRHFAKSRKNKQIKYWNISLDLVTFTTWPTGFYFLSDYDTVLLLYLSYIIFYGHVYIVNRSYFWNESKMNRTLGKCLIIRRTRSENESGSVFPPSSSTRADGRRLKRKCSGRHFHRTRQQLESTSFLKNMWVKDFQIDVYSRPIFRRFPLHSFSLSLSFHWIKGQKQSGQSLLKNFNDFSPISNEIVYENDTNGLYAPPQESQK